MRPERDRSPSPNAFRPWNAKNRGQDIQLASRRDFDLVIIGGGITGAGVAREAALRGLSFCLVDKGDFASGTSSRSSKLAHGGMRYLATGELALVRTAATERNWLLHHLPNLVTPVGFIVSAYRSPGSRDTPGSIRTGLRLYRLLSDAFSRFKNHDRHTFIPPSRITDYEPKIRTEALRLSGLYYDANVNDARLVIETLQDALRISGGRSVALNYMKVTELSHNGGMVTGVYARNQTSGQVALIHGRAVVNATGVWTDDILALHGVEDRVIRPTKGVHVVVPASRVGNRHSIGLRSVDDGRFYFILKHGEWDIIGTTDTDYAEDRDDPFCTRKDCEYLLHSVNVLFPGANLTPQDVISTYAGIRPLRLQPGKKESSVSRRHFIIDDDDRLVTVAGGKLTEFRKMAEDVLFLLSRKGYVRRFRGPESKKGFSKIPYRCGISLDEFNREILADRLAEFASYEQLAHFHRQYGRAAFAILRKIRQRPESGTPFLTGYPYCRAEIEHILETENAANLSDVMLRRTEMQIFIPYARQKEAAEKTADVLRGFFGWTEGKMRQEVSAYMNGISHTAYFLNRPPRHPSDGRRSGPRRPRESRPRPGNFPARKD